MYVYNAAPTGFPGEMVKKCKLARHIYRKKEEWFNRESLQPVRSCIIEEEERRGDTYIAIISNKRNHDPANKEQSRADQSDITLPIAAH